VCREVWSASDVRNPKAAMASDLPTPDTGASRSATDRLLGRGTWRDARYVASILRQETVGGALLLGAALAALLWANSPWRDAYVELRDSVVGWQFLHLDLSLEKWAADGLLAIFFLVAGIELKREFVAGELSDRRKAALPIAAAVAGVALPAVLYAVTVFVMTRSTGEDVSVILRGWAVPTATDIAFALAVLAVIGTHLPSALRSFLLTLAVVDDLIAITIIAVFYTETVKVLWLLAAVVPLAVWRILLQKRLTNPFLLAVPAVLAWVFVHSSGVHATVAGVLLGLLVPVNRKPGDEDAEGHSLAERLEHKIRPFSAGFAVPVFAFFAAGVTVVGGGLTAALRDPAAIGVIVGLVVGKSIGVLAGTWGVARFTRAQLDEDLAWTDIFGLSILSGVGFTVSLLVGELAFGSGSERDEHVKFAVLAGSLIAAIFAAVVLRLRNRHYRLVEAREQLDRDRDGVPDAFEEPERA
jgi:NhaA family Na+:H+ antiporter